MAISTKKIRVFYWILRDLFTRYRRALLIGFSFGLILTIVIGRLTPVFLSSLFYPTERIGIVGEITLDTLPVDIQQKVSYGLTTLAPDGTVLPGIAESWNYEENGKQIVFLLKDLTWHNGKKVQAVDINYNINGVVFQVIDQKTLRAILPEPYSPFATIVSRPVFKQGLVGVGSYKFSQVTLKGNTIERFTLTDSSRKEPNKQYYTYRTEQQAIVAYKRGDIDRIEELSSVADLKNWKHTEIKEEENFQRIVGVYFNTNNQLFSEKSFRQGLAYAIPDLGRTRPTSPIPKTSWAHSTNVRVYTADQEQAKKLLAQTTLPENFSGITITTFPQYVDVASAIAQSWTSLGVQTTVKVQNSLEGEFEVLLSAQDVPPDPDQYPFWHSQQKQTNITGYENVRVDKLLEDGRVELDREKRKKLYGDFQRFIMEDAPAVFLYHPITYTVFRT